MRTQIQRTRCLYGSRRHRLGRVDGRHSSVADGAATNFGGAADERMPLSTPRMANRTDTERAKALSPWTDA
jgi:hypothetical protein